MGTSATQPTGPKLPATLMIATADGQIYPVITLTGKSGYLLQNGRPPVFITIRDRQRRNRKDQPAK